MKNEKSDTPLISVIIPCFNYGRYIRAAIESVDRQNYPALEFIIIDDGSDDHYTQEQLERLRAEGYTVIQTSRRYPAAARNLGFEHARGAYLLTLDADDLMHTDFIRKALAVFAADPGVGAVSSWVLGFGYYDFLWKPSGGVLDDFLFRINCSCFALIKREAWIQTGGFDESFTTGYEDWDFWIGLTKRGWRIEIIPEPLFYYRQKANSRVHDTNKRKDPIYLKIIRKHLDVFYKIASKTLDASP